LVWGLAATLALSLHSSNEPGELSQWLAMMTAPYISARLLLLLLLLVKISVFQRGLGHFQHKFQGKGRSSTNDSWCQKARVAGLSRGVVCMILHLAVLIQYWRVTHRQTDDDGYYLCIA